MQKSLGALRAAKTAEFPVWNSNNGVRLCFSLSGFFLTFLLFYSPEGIFHFLSLWRGRAARRLRGRLCKLFFLQKKTFRKTTGGGQQAFWKGVRWFSCPAWRRRAALAARRAWNGPSFFSLCPRNGGTRKMKLAHCFASGTIPVFKNTLRALRVCHAGQGPSGFLSSSPARGRRAATSPGPGERARRGCWRRSRGIPPASRFPAPPARFIFERGPLAPNCPLFRAPPAPLLGNGPGKVGLVKNAAAKTARSPAEASLKFFFRGTKRGLSALRMPSRAPSSG